MEPDVGRCAPARHEKRVVLPAPFGPMTPKISPGATSNETPLTATRPPKRTVSARTETTGSGIEVEAPQASRPKAPHEAEEALRLEEHDGDQQRPIDEERGAEQGRDRQELELEPAEEDRAEDRSRHGPDSANDRHQDDREAQAEVEHRAGRYVLEIDREQAARQADERGREGVYGDLQARGVHAERRGGSDVLPDGGEGRAESAPRDGERDPDERHGEERHRSEVRLEVVRARGHPEPARAAREREARRHDAHGLSDADRGDGEVRAPQPERGIADDHRESPGEERAERQREDRRRATQGEKHGRVGADPEKSGVTDRNLAGEAAEEVPRRGQHDGQRHAPQVVQGAPLEKGRSEIKSSRDGEHAGRFERSLRGHPRRLTCTRRKSPGSPCGSTTSVTTRSVKLRASWRDVGTAV